MQLKAKDGFTLIELLIVVAIIAILAAISIPNFLEAQTRAKVVRDKAGYRTLAIGFESYRVDNSAALPCDVGFVYNGLFQRESNGAFYWWSCRWPFRRPLTTPVAYLTTVPADLFLREAYLKTYGPEFDYSPAVWDNNICQALLMNPVGSAPGIWGPIVGLNRGTIKTYVVAAFVQNNHANASFMIRGMGPRWDPSTYSYTLAYDPTNGTMSTGHIFYFQ